MECFVQTTGLLCFCIEKCLNRDCCFEVNSMLHRLHIFQGDQINYYKFVVTCLWNGYYEDVHVLYGTEEPSTQFWSTACKPTNDPTCTQSSATECQLIHIIIAPPQFQISSCIAPRASWLFGSIELVMLFVLMLLITWISHTIQQTNCWYRHEMIRSNNTLLRDLSSRRPRAKTDVVVTLSSRHVRSDKSTQPILWRR